MCNGFKYKISWNRVVGVKFLCLSNSWIFSLCVGVGDVGWERDRSGD